MQPLTQVIPGALVALLRDSPMSPGKADFAWQVVVGPAMARVTSVRLEADVLLIDAQTPAWGREIRRGSSLILKRLQSLLGPRVIREIVVRA